MSVRTLCVRVRVCPCASVRVLERALVTHCPPCPGARGDLAGDDGGCYDTKVTRSSWIAAAQAEVVNGPTTAGGTLPPFAWTAAFPELHVGQPTEFDFSFETMVPADV